nr:unnamed protein product [Callosobruchus analis]
MEKNLQKAHLWIKFLSTNDEIREAQHLWQQVYMFPAAIGVVDCTHGRISKPGQFGDEYINMKGIASINVQATCSAQEKFTNVDVQWPKKSVSKDLNNGGFATKQKQIIIHTKRSKCFFLYLLLRSISF